MNDYQYMNENGSPRDYYEIVNENGELCKEIERLNKELEEKEAILGGIQQLEAEVERLNNEIDRLNETNIVLEDSTNHWYHIVEELEKVLKNEIERTETLIQYDYEHSLGSFGNIRKMLNEERKNWLYKIKELKGSNGNEQ